LSGDGLIKILVRKGYREMRSKGSHVRLYPPEGHAGLKKVTVPLHKELKVGTLSAILRDTGLTSEDIS
jgi:predicted RNA binding protein YcfA (HicA-like mRNA interferase family)